MLTRALHICHRKQLIHRTNRTSADSCCIRLALKQPCINAFFQKSICPNCKISSVLFGPWPDHVRAEAATALTPNATNGEKIKALRTAQGMSLGKRISNARKQTGITQEALGEQLNMTRKHISVIEAAINRPSLDTLVDIANALNVSADDLLVDSLTHSASTADSEIHRLLLDCNTLEQEILTRMVKELKAILYGLGV